MPREHDDACAETCSAVIPGRAEWREPGIDAPQRKIWILGSPLPRHPGMTGEQAAGIGTAAITIFLQAVLPFAIGAGKSV